MRSRTVAWLSGCLAVAALGTAGFLTAAAATNRSDEVDPAPGATSVVERADLNVTTTISGTLVYDDEREIDGNGRTLTWLPDRGAQVSAGGVMYRSDDAPVVLLTGTYPMWRPLTTGVDDGDDVLQLERNLQAFGFFGPTPDRHFDWSTAEAIRKWQKSLGVPRTGRLEPSSVIVSADSVIVRDVLVELGDAASGPILKVSAQGKSVVAEVPIRHRALTAPGTAVTVSLPDGSTATGSVSRADSPQEAEGANGPTTIVPIAIALNDPLVGGDLAEVGVRVDLVAPGRKDVLRVPVGAVLALPDGAFGVELKTQRGTRAIPVELGLFAGGFVEIVDGDLNEGDEVVVPA